MSEQLERGVNRDLDIVAIVVALVMAGVASWVGVVPTLESDDMMRRLTGQVANSHQQLEGLQSEFRTVRSSIQGAREELAESYVELYGTEQLATRQGQLHALLSSEGITVEQLVVGSIARGERLDTVALRLDGKGAFPVCVRVMRLLRSEFPDMAVTSFQISKTAADAPGRQFESDRTEFQARFVFDIEWYAARTGRAGS